MMGTMRVLTYGDGGYDPGAPDGNLLSDETIEVPDTGDAPTVADVRAQVAQLVIPDAVRSALDGVLVAVEQHVAADQAGAASDSGSQPGIIGRILGR